MRNGMRLAATVSWPRLETVPRALLTSFHIFSLYLNDAFYIFSKKYLLHLRRYLGNLRSKKETDEKKKTKGTLI